MAHADADDSDDDKKVAGHPGAASSGQQPTGTTTSAGVGGSTVTSVADMFPNYSEWAQQRIRRSRHWRKSISDTLARARDVILRRRTLPPTKDGRKIPLRIPPADRELLIDERSGKPYIDNNITSSIYTPYDFLPRQIVFQFSKLANLYVCLFFFFFCFLFLPGQGP